jgi:cell division protein FtsB
MEKENEALKKEIEELKREIEKLKEKIRHYVSAMKMVSPFADSIYKN